MKILSICAKCSDMFSLVYKDEESNITKTYNGYVPNWFPNPNIKHYGDYVILNIDINTGIITNWKTPSEKELKKIFEA